MPTQKLTCSDCNKQFDFIEGEQKFFKEKGWPEPKRCQPCRRAVKVKRQKLEIEKAAEQND